MQRDQDRRGGTTFELGRAPATLADVAFAASAGTELSVAPGARRRIEAARRVVDRYAAGDEPIYGLNTGLGGNVGFRLSRAEIEAFQVQMVRGRCIGVGEPFPASLARMMLLCRLIGLAQGGSGISPAVFDRMMAMFNAGLAPVIPGRGSIGAGDLGLCAHIGAAVIGEGEIWVDGQRRPASEALREAGLRPATLGPKDGLAILNSSAVTCGHAVAVLDDLRCLLDLSALTAALSLEGYAANPRIFDARLAAARPASGQERAAALFRRLLEGSALHAPGAARSIQDALSFRTLSQIHGTALTSFDAAVGAVETEINGAADNPLVMADDDLILSTANFHTPAIALAFDTMAIAMAHLATASAYRTIKMMNPALSGLPKYLTPVGGAANGFNSLQKTASYLHGEIRLKAMPASLDAIAVSETVEDHAPQTPLTIRKLEEQLSPFRLLLAIEALVGAQAVDLRRRPQLGRAPQALLDAIREVVPMLVDDRPTGRDVDRLAALFEGRDFSNRLASLVAPP